MNAQVLVIIGAGGIGQAIARRQGPGRTILLSDFNETTLTAAADALEGRRTHRYNPACGRVVTGVRRRTRCGRRGPR